MFTNPLHTPPCLGRTAEGRRERAPSELCVNNFHQFSNRLNNSAFLVCVRLSAPVPGWQVGSAGAQTVDFSTAPA